MRRSAAEEAARLVAAAGRGEGTVGEEPGAGAAVPALRPGQGGRSGGFSPAGIYKNMETFKNKKRVSFRNHIHTILTVEDVCNTFLLPCFFRC